MCLARSNLERVRIPYDRFTTVVPETGGNCGRQRKTNIAGKPYSTRAFRYFFRFLRKRGIALFLLRMYGVRSSQSPPLHQVYARVVISDAGFFFRRSANDVLCCGAAMFQPDARAPRYGPFGAYSA